MHCPNSVVAHLFCCLKSNLDFSRVVRVIIRKCNAAVFSEKLKAPCRTAEILKTPYNVLNAGAALVCGNKCAKRVQNVMFTGN